MQEMRDRTGGEEPRSSRGRPLRHDRVEDAEMEEITQGLAAINQDNDSESEGGIAMMSEGSASGSGDDASVFSAGSSYPSLGSSASTHSTAT